MATTPSTEMTYPARAARRRPSWLSQAGYADPDPPVQPGGTESCGTASWGTASCGTESGGTASCGPQSCGTGPGGVDAGSRPTGPWVTVRTITISKTAAAVVTSANRP